MALGATDNCLAVNAVFRIRRVRLVREWNFSSHLFADVAAERRIIGLRLARWRDVLNDIHDKARQRARRRTERENYKDRQAQNESELFIRRASLFVNHPLPKLKLFPLWQRAHEPKSSPPKTRRPAMTRLPL